MVEMKNLTCYQIQERPARIIPARSDRPWMDATDDRFAYRCLPLSIANAMGWEILLPTTISATWNGGNGNEDISVTVADPSYAAEQIAASHFGFGTLTLPHRLSVPHRSGRRRLGARRAEPAEGRHRPARRDHRNRLARFYLHDELEVHAAGNGDLRKGRAVLLPHPCRLYGARRRRSRHHADHRKAGIGAKVSTAGARPGPTSMPASRRASPRRFGSAGRNGTRAAKTGPTAKRLRTTSPRSGLPSRYGARKQTRPATD